MEKEKSKINSITKPATGVVANQLNRHLYTDTERQLFNASLSVNQFLREARKDEANCVNARRRCRSLLEAGRTLDARSVAKEALQARGRAFACSAVAKRIDWLVNKLNDECSNGFKPEIVVALRALDSAVLCNDLWKAKRVINIILTEIEKVEAPDIPESPTEKEVTQYLKQLKEEIVILNRLKYENRASEELSEAPFYSYENPDSGEVSDVSSMVSSASRMRLVQFKPKRTRKTFRVAERSLYE